MSDLIERDTLIHVVKEWLPCNKCNKEIQDSILENLCVSMLMEIEEQPTVDAVPVVHGQWIGKPIAGYCDVRCSVCRKVLLSNSGNYLYCPNCGVKMDEKDGENNGK